jgi:hypothetical protein
MSKQWKATTRGGPSTNWQGIAVRNIRDGSTVYGRPAIEAELLRLGQWRNSVFSRDGKYLGMDVGILDRSLDLVEVQS